AREARAEKKLSDRRWYAAEITLARQDLKEARIATVFDRLEALRPQQPDAEDLRGFEWYFLQRQCRPDLRTLGGHTAAVWGVAYSLDGRRLASAGGELGQPGEIRIWDVATGAEVRSWRGHADRVLSVAFSPDGSRLATASGGLREPGEIKIWD